MNKESNSVAFDDDGIATFPDRLKGLIENESLRKFALAVGISEGGLRKYLPPGRSKPTFDKLVAISRYKNVNIEWLATGVGPMMIGDELKQPPASITNAEFNEEFILVPGYHIQVSTGNGACFQGEEVKRHLAFRRKYLKYRQSNPDLLAVVFSKGDSMEPTIKDNDSLLIDLGCTEPKDGKIFVVRIGDDLYAKRIQQLVSGGLVLISDNKEYREQVIQPDEVNQLQVIGQVIWIGKDV
ncbi:LexA family transcriptional regulator [Photobacterium sanguinicancri]|nr:helix-turn-helix transcriptional regulator [Photobacterium sanguinicancri]MDO6542784.1 helix-turn-helix transcriptional regulator [Photobacterium sanguinicancri]